jgi:hypothetical protein
MNGAVVFSEAELDEGVEDVWKCNKQDGMDRLSRSREYPHCTAAYTGCTGQGGALEPDPGDWITQ